MKWQRNIILGYGQLKELKHCTKQANSPRKNTKNLQKERMINNGISRKNINNAER